jgi:RimJ/RimL family protein N-acetyltransferase
MRLTYRCLLATDAGWLTEMGNDPEAARYALSVYPRTEYETEQFVKKELEDHEGKTIVAEVDGDPAGNVGVWWRNVGRDRHVAWLFLGVRRKHWAKGVGLGLVKEAIGLAKEAGCRRMVLGMIEGNERAARLYKKCGFKTEAYENDEVYIDGSWRRNLVMGLDLSPCTPRYKQKKSSQAPSGIRPSHLSVTRLQVRQLMNGDLDEIHRLQNCPESTKSTYRIPPTTKEESKQWYQSLGEGKYCFACFRKNTILGYLHFRAYHLPFPCLKFEEIIVDVNEQPFEAADALISAVRQFRERYAYRKVFAQSPQHSTQITEALEQQGFKKTGAIKAFYLTDDHYADMELCENP